MDSQYFVYILASKKNGTLYIGVTSDLAKRVYEHKQKFVDGFTKKYDVTQLVYYEVHASAEAANHREKCMKEWQRAWKVKRIEEMNPEWRDLYESLLG